ncbi:MAG: molecular chaperone DnaK [Archangium gephyra]|uniref:Molecular chaperone DnaK n=1 Tax=Archangium gephyra TaxID=48 RepID=A0A2W5UX01_9BACT|nr:MAG: molecular chaperone DnaK [Archangium gephyra]
MSPSIGIDLGTTNSAVATASGPAPRIIERATGQRLLPSLVGITDDGLRVVGDEARLLGELSPERVASATKRFIGQRWTPELAAKARLLYPYSLVAGPTEDVRIRIGPQTLPVSQISGMLLSELRADAEDLFGVEVTDSVITVPANFTDAQRTATREAAEIAGLNVLRLLNEPTAAAMAYGLANGFKGTALVFDLGGGTFDVSVLRIQDGVFEVLATAGDPFFGGDDFDNTLVQWLLSHVHDSATRERLTHDRATVQHLKTLAERAKREVSTAEFSRISATLQADSRYGAVPIETMLTRPFFEKLVRPKTEHALSIVEQALLEANLNAGDVDTVLLVGGMTRVPLLRQLVAKHFGKEPDARVDPDEAVALGAAIHAAELVEKRGKTLLLDVVGSSMGVQVAGGLVKPVLARNTMLPCRASEVFFPGRDGQTVVRVPVVQGEGKRAEECTRVCELVLGDLTATLRKAHEIEVTFAMDVEGMLSVSAVDKLSGVAEEIRIDARTNLAASEAAQLAQREAQHREEHTPVDAEERRQNRHARRALHGAVVAVRRLQIELSHVARESEEADAKELSALLAPALIEADIVERSGTREEVEAMTQKLLALLPA